MNFLFWNINGKDLSDNIALLCEKYSTDVLILAESSVNDNNLLLKLNINESSYYPPNPLSNCTKIKIFTKFHFDFIPPVSESVRFTIRKISLPAQEEFLLTSIHYIDKSNHSNESQSEMASILIKQIEATEIESGLSKNIVVGDFNMNPFEKGMIKANGFNATMSEDIALGSGRVVQGSHYRYFYNPMWSLYGDLMTKPAGTYFYPSSELVSYQWNIFDQVLLRPEIISNFDKTSLEIITTDGVNNFVRNNNRPNSGLFSDHLPIKFTINF
ncbi:endonuclease/exonuclease/phosphatase family protein [Ferruginibacter sp.]